MEKIMSENLKGQIAVRKFAEAMREGKVDEVMTTSDFGFIADLIDRSVAVGYTETKIPITYPILGYRRDTISFEEAKDYRLNKVKRVKKVDEKAPYLPNEPSEEYFTYKTYKFGEQFDISWEAWLRDGRDLRLIQDLYGAMSAWGTSVEYTKEYEFTAAWAKNAVLFAGANGNDLNLALSEANFSTALATLKNFTDPSGNTTVFGGRVYLVVPSALEATALRIIGSQNTVTGSDINIGSYNPAFRSAEVIVPPFLEELDSATAWYIFCDPAVRPAVRYGYVSGYDQPEVFIKSDTAKMLSGQNDPWAGDFSNDDIELKMRFTFGADIMDWRGCIRSKP